MPSTSTVYCIKCGCERPYSVASSREVISVKGVVFSAVLMSAHCRECGEEVYVPEINDENVKSREAEYRRAAKLITVEEVDGILKKYNIGACPLAKLLGFGDITITRYLDGQLPSRANSDILLRILASHKTMEEYLEKGKDKITAIAYQKCRGALDNLLQLYGEGKIELVTRYILFKAKDITPMALQKLLYYVHQILGVDNDLRFISPAEKRQNMLSTYLCLIHGSSPTKACGKPFCDVIVERPR